jgi:hypothetical protein
MMSLEHLEFDGMTTTYCLEVHSMKETQLNSAAFVLSWYRQNVDPRANHARLEIGPEGTRLEERLSHMKVDCRTR